MPPADIHVLDHIPVALDLVELRQTLHIAPDSDDAEELTRLVDRAAPLINAKALYAVAYIDDRGQDTVTFGGATFRSRVLRVNLDAIERVFPYVATCGREIAGLELAAGDLLHEFWLDAIKGVALKASLQYLGDHLARRYALGKTATMNPGSADRDVWPIEQQRELFGLFGNVERLVGVRLTDTCLMLPNKTVSGVRFATTVDFRSCQVCHRPVCPSRAAAFDEKLAALYEHGPTAPGAE
ncbi:vitamin B12 dependent methionine synthase [bacterium]|nr:vitamin B12 dependent methionine synthase [bacterium]